MKETKALVGGEENGSFIWREWSLTRDGVLASVAMLDLMIKTRKSLPELDSLFPKRSQVKAGIDCSGDLLLPIMRKIRDDIPDAEEVILVDGIRLGFADREWVLIRPSGTEHKIRVFSEASTETRAQELNGLGMSLTRKAIEELAT
jgi:phosphomannomutase/phosphoglucomutase